MGSTFNSRPYESVRGPTDAFSVKQLPFVTVMRRPSTASSASAAHAQPDPADRQALPAQNLRPITSSAPRAAAFSPKWACERLRGATPSEKMAQPIPKQHHGNRVTAFAQREGGPFAQREGGRVPSAEAAVFEDNHTLRAAVSALQAMVLHEKKMHTDIDAQVELCVCVFVCLCVCVFVCLGYCFCFCL